MMQCGYLHFCHAYGGPQWPETSVAPGSGQPSQEARSAWFCCGQKSPGGGYESEISHCRTAAQTEWISPSEEPLSFATRAHVLQSKRNVTALY